MSRFKKIIMVVFMLLPVSSAASECVVLLHGLARSDNSMKKMETRLIKEGYHVVNVDYPSTKAAIDVLSKEAVERGLKACPKGSSVHFVTHSLGGILLRYYLEESAIEKLGRVVMLGPPNQGSEVVDTLGGLSVFEWINGPAGLQLGTGKNSVPKKLGAANFDLGIIAGKQSINWMNSMMLPGADDGKVTVENTKLEGMNDHITMKVTHPFLMKNEKVIRQVIYYLKNGEFKRKKVTIQHNIYKITHLTS